MFVLYNLQKFVFSIRYVSSMLLPGSIHYNASLPRNSLWNGEGTEEGSKIYPSLIRLEIIVDI